MQNAATLIDTGPLVAILDVKDQFHADCLAAFKLLPSPLHTTWPVITEAAYLLGESSPAVAKLFELIRSGALELLPLRVADVDGIESILTKYRDQAFQLADASLMHLANREGLTQVLTLDRKDFTVFRTEAGSQLTLLPEPT